MMRSTMMRTTMMMRSTNDHNDDCDNDLTMIISCYLFLVGHVGQALLLILIQRVDEETKLDDEQLREEQAKGTHPKRHYDHYFKYRSYWLTDAVATRFKSVKGVISRAKTAIANDISPAAAAQARTDANNNYQSKKNVSHNQ